MIRRGAPATEARFVARALYERPRGSALARECLSALVGHPLESIRGQGRSHTNGLFTLQKRVLPPRLVWERARARMPSSFRGHG